MAIAVPCFDSEAFPPLCSDPAGPPLSCSEPAASSPIVRLNGNYSLKEFLGRTTRSTFFRTEDLLAKDGTVTRELTAMCFKDLMHNSTEAKRTLRELTLLRMLDSPNVIRLLDITTIFAEQMVDFTDLYAIVEKVDCTLSDLIKQRELTDDEIRAFTYECFKGLHYIHTAKVVHRDLSPKNCLVTVIPLTLKLASFGLARSVARDEYILEEALCLSYRSPEAICDRYVYGYPFDMWATGLIIAEMFTRRPFLDFCTENNLADQIEGVIAVVGTPTDEQINRIRDPSAKAFVQSLPKKQRCVFSKLEVDAGRRKVPDSPKQMIDFLLQWSPLARLNAATFLKHPYFNEIRKPETEVVSAVEMPTGFEFEFEAFHMYSAERHKQQLRDLFVQEWELYHLDSEE